MAMSNRILAQAVASTAASSVYVVPAGTQAVLSTIHIANTSSTTDIPIRLFAAVDNTATTATALAYDVVIPKNSFLALTEGITLNAASTISIRAAVANAVTFTVFGCEIS